MKNIYFPTTIVDDFFDDPDQVREYGLNLLKNQSFPMRHYPGVRSEPIQQNNPKLFNAICYRFLRLFFNGLENPSPGQHMLNWKAGMSFQLVDGSYGSGWVHKDDAIATGIIYLTPDSQNDIGTSIYQKKHLMSDQSISDYIEEKRIGNEQKRCDHITRNKVNSQFKEVINVQGLYNRALFFDSHLYHSAHNFIGNNLESSRLTLTVFFFAIDVGEQFYPIPRSKKFSLLQI